jgi:chorismate--pyruvate lyase
MNPSAIAPVPLAFDAPTPNKTGNWRPARQHLRHTLPRETLAWLLDPASLTRRVVAVCPGRFRVEVVSQEWRRPLLDEAQVLGVHGGGYALVRQVYLLCDEQPWVFARTVIPRTTLTGQERRLAHLRARPLGEVLFADPSMRRGEVQIARLAAGNCLFRHATQRLVAKPASIWGRRSLFTLSDKPLLVNEIFLPDIPPCLR